MGNGICFPQYQDMLNRVKHISPTIRKQGSFPDTYVYAHSVLALKRIIIMLKMCVVRQLIQHFKLANQACLTETRTNLIIIYFINVQNYQNCDGSLRKQDKTTFLGTTLIINTPYIAPDFPRTDHFSSQNLLTVSYRQSRSSVDSF